jgi:putrescine aminotransferase
VITGFGRLGRWFGHQFYGIQPDLISMAKGLTSGYLPMSAVAVSEAMVETLREPSGQFYHGYTYSGHPTCAAVALKNLEIIEREDLVARTADDTAPYLAEAMASLADHPLVGETRTIGLLGAVEIVSLKGTNQRFPGAQAAKLAIEACLARGVVVRGARESIVVSPPLTISHGEIDEMVSRIRAGLDDLEPALRATLAQAAE